MVEGTVIDQSGKAVAGATIANQDAKRTVKTDMQGRFELKISSLDTLVYMFHEVYGEIAIRGYDFKSRHRVVIRFNPASPYDEPQTVKKPVIYLYADEPTAVSISLQHPGLTFTYPALNTRWNMRADSTGNLTDMTSGRTYPYLFWEAETRGLNYVQKQDHIPGFLIATDSLISFLESSLSTLGLTEREQTDFITFWAPQLIQTPFVFIQFLTDQTYDEKIAHVDIQPQPEAMRRIFLLYTPLSSPLDFPLTPAGQQLAGFERSGLTFVEWGGAAVNLSVLTAPAN